MKELSKTKAWDKREDETDTAYQRFSVYLKMGPDRSQMGVVEKLGKRRGYEKQLQRWSSQHDWVARCSEYDNHLLKKELKNKEDILDRGKARLLKMMDKSLDELEGVIEMNDVLYVGEGGTSVVAQKLKAIDSVLNRIGLIEQKELPPAGGGSVTINNYVQNIYNKMRRLEDE